MFREESDAMVECLDCGTPLDVDRERGFALGNDMALCWSCARSRGAEFDEEEGRWRSPPDTEGLVIDDEHRVR